MEGIFWEGIEKYLSLINLTANHSKAPLLESSQFSPSTNHTDLCQSWVKITARIQKLNFHCYHIIFISTRFLYISINLSSTPEPILGTVVDLNLLKLL